MSTRFLVGVGAWLLGAGAATGGSLLAVSLLGQGLAPAPSQQLTVAAVNRALAGVAAKASRSLTPAPSSTPSPPPSATPSRRHHQARSAAPATPPPAAPAPQSTSRVLTSVGGTVVAGCQASGAYLISWSPQQGYQASHVIRGPAAKAKATFSNAHRQVIMVVTCDSGVPAAATTIRNWGDE